MPDTTIESISTPRTNPFKPIGEVVQKRGLKIGIYGAPATGKTHFGFTCPGPIYFIDTESGAAPLSKMFPGKDVHVIQIREKNPEIEKLESEWDEVNYFEKILNAVDYLYDHPVEGGTIVIDSVTDVWSWCQSYTKIKKLKIKPEDRPKFQFDWGKINAEYINPMFKLINTPMNIVMLARAKTKYDSLGKATEETVSGWQAATGYMLDITVESYRLDNKKGTPKFFSSIVKCRSNGAIMNKEIENLNFDTLKMLIDETAPLNTKPVVDMGPKKQSEAEGL